jgi:hypothetical protein
VGCLRADCPRASRPPAGCPCASWTRPGWTRAVGCPCVSWTRAAGCPCASWTRASWTCPGFAAKPWRQTGASLHPTDQCGRASGRDQNRWRPAFPGRDLWTRRPRQAADLPSGSSRFSGHPSSCARSSGFRRLRDRPAHGRRCYQRRSLLVALAFRVPQPRKPNLQRLPQQYPGKRRGPLNLIGSDPLQACPAASYSPTRSPTQYHRR